MKIENTTNSDNVQELGTLIKEVRNNVRNISHELMPPEFEHLSLDEILYQYADKLSENTGIQVTYTSGQKTSCITHDRNQVWQKAFLSLPQLP